MKVLYFTQFYAPENNAGAFRARDHATTWVDLGEDVTIFTGWPNYPTGRVFEGYDVTLLAEDNDDHVKVLRSKLIARPNANLVARVANGMSFFFFGIVNIVFNARKIGGRFDVVLASSGMIFTGYLGLFFARIHNLPLVVEFRDITFEQMVATGSKRSSCKVRLMRCLEVHLSKAASKVVVLTNGFKHILEKEGVDPSNISVVPNGADSVDCVRNNPVDRINLAYFGTMGISQDVPSTFRYVALIQKITGVNTEYTLIGEGAARGEIEAGLASGKFPFVNLEHGMSQAELEPYYRECDLAVVCLSRSESFKSTIPSKIFHAFARGVPVLFVGPEGEAAQLVRDANGGIVLVEDEDENIDTLMDFFLRSDFKQQLNLMGKASRAFLEKHYTRSKLAEDMLRTLREASNERKRTHG